MEVVYVYGNYQMGSLATLLGIGGYFLFFCLGVFAILLFIRRPWRKK